MPESSPSFDLDSLTNSLKRIKAQQQIALENLQALGAEGDVGDEELKVIEERKAYFAKQNARLEQQIAALTASSTVDEPQPSPTTIDTPGLGTEVPPKTSELSGAKPAADVVPPPTQTEKSSPTSFFSKFVKPSSPPNVTNQPSAEISTPPTESVPPEKRIWKGMDQTNIDTMVQELMKAYAPLDNDLLSLLKGTVEVRIQLELDDDAQDAQALRRQRLEAEDRLRRLHRQYVTDASESSASPSTSPTPASEAKPRPPVSPPPSPVVDRPTPPPTPSRPPETRPNLGPRNDKERQFQASIDGELRKLAGLILKKVIPGIDTEAALRQRPEYQLLLHENYHAPGRHQAQIWLGDQVAAGERRLKTEIAKVNTAFGLAEKSKKVVFMPDGGHAPNYYQILGVNSTASDTEIKDAFRKLSRRYHPDIALYGDEVFKLINEAYEVLGDATKRAQFDRALSFPSGSVFNRAPRTDRSRAADSWADFFKEGSPFADLFREVYGDGWANFIRTEGYGAASPPTPEETKKNKQKEAVQAEIRSARTLIDLISAVKKYAQLGGVLDASVLSNSRVSAGEVVNTLEALWQKRDGTDEEIRQLLAKLPYDLMIRSTAGSSIQELRTARKYLKDPKLAEFRLIDAVEMYAKQVKDVEYNSSEGKKQIKTADMVAAAKELEILRRELNGFIDKDKFGRVDHRSEKLKIAQDKIIALLRQASPVFQLDVKLLHCLRFSYGGYDQWHRDTFTVPEYIADRYYQFLQEHFPNDYKREVKQ